MQTLIDLSNNIKNWYFDQPKATKIAIIACSTTLTLSYITLSYYPRTYLYAGWKTIPHYYIKPNPNALPNDNEIYTDTGLHLNIYKPSNINENKKYGCIIMAHGLAHIKAQSLDKYAKYFSNNSNIYVITFDYKTFGLSNKNNKYNRHFVDSKQHLMDYINVINYITKKDNILKNKIDNNKIGIWGTSFAGGHVLSLYAQQKVNILCAVSQVPFLGFDFDELSVGNNNVTPDYISKLIFGYKINKIRQLPILNLFFNELYCQIIGEKYDKILPILYMDDPSVNEVESYANFANDWKTDCNYDKCEWKNAVKIDSLIDILTYKPYKPIIDEEYLNKKKMEILIYYFVIRKMMQYVLQKILNMY